MRVLTTQMGFVSSTVAEPAMAPAIIDSMVVSFMLARPDLRAAFSKKERVHSYPGFTCQRYYSIDVTVHARTVVVDKVRNGDAEQRAVQARVQACDALALDDPARGAQSGGLRALRLDLGACRERDEGVCQGHGEQASTGAGEGVGDIVALLRGGAGGHGGRRLGELLLGFVLDLGHGVDRFEAGVVTVVVVADRAKVRYGLLKERRAQLLGSVRRAVDSKVRCRVRIRWHLWRFLGLGSAACEIIEAFRGCSSYLGNAIHASPPHPIS